MSGTVAAQPVGRVEAGGWPNVVSSLLSQFANFDVITLGEAHGRNEDLELRLRLIRHPELPRDVSLVVAEFSDDRVTAAVAEANRQRAGAVPVQLIVLEADAAASIISENVQRRQKAIVVYGAGHLWKREGGLTTALSAAGARVLVVQTLAPPTPASTLARLDALIKRPERPLLLSLEGAAVGRTPANDVFPGEPLAPSLTLADLADVAVIFEADTVAPAAVSAAVPEPIPTPASSITLNGRLAGFFRRPEGQHVYLVLAVETRTGSPERWIVQGGSVKELTEWGWRLDPPSVRLGEQLRVQVQVLPGDLDAEKLAADAPPQVIAALKMGRPLVYGVEVTRGDGRTLPLGTKR